MKRRRIESDRLSTLPAPLLRCIMAFAPFAAVLFDWPLVCKATQTAARPERDKRVAVVHAMMVDIKAVTDKLRTEHFRPNMDHLLAILCVLQLDLPALHVPSPAIIMHWAYAAMAWRGKPTHIVMIARQKHWGHVGATMTETAHLIDEKRDRTIEEMIAPTSNVLSPVARNGLFLGAALSTSDLALYTSIDVAVQESNWSADGVTSMVAGRRASRTIFLDDEVRPARFMWPIDSRRCSRVFAFCHVGCML